MMTVEQYEELYCTYCDSQRCGNQNLPVEKMCPYWKQRVQGNNTNNGSTDDNQLRV